MASNLRFAIDGNEANLKNRVGVNEYSFQIIKHLEKLTRNRNISITVLLNAEPIGDLPPARKNWVYQIITPARFWTQWAASWYMYKHKHDFDVYYTPSHYLPRYCPIPAVVTIHDLAFLEYPDHFKITDLIKLKDWTKYSTLQAERVLAVSNFTKKDLINRYRLKPEIIDLASPALDENHPRPLKRDQPKILKNFGIKGNFLLYVGTLQPRKNLNRLIQAFDELADQKKYKKLSLVLAGKSGWLTKPILNEIAEATHSDRIILTGYISEAEKWTLYDAAKAIVLPGLYEGFGMPALEAMSVGTIPVVSNTGSLSEVVNSAGITVDPLSVDSIKKGIDQALNLKDTKLKQYRQQMSVRVKNYSWNKSARTVFKHLEEMATEND